MCIRDSFGYGRHTGGIAADRLEIAVFGLSLERRARAADVDAVLQLDPLAFGDGRRLGSQLAVVTVVHVRKTGPQLGDVGADERIGHQIDMVLSLIHI